MTPRGQLRVSFVTDIKTPYMAAAFAALADEVDLEVIYCSEAGSRAGGWAFEGGLPFAHRVLSGLTIRRGDVLGTDFYLTPRTFGAVARRRPDAIVCAGYSFPTAYAAQYSLLTGTPLLIHSDGSPEYEATLGRAQGIARKALLPLTALCIGNSEVAHQRFLEMGVPPERLRFVPHTTEMRPLWEAADRRRSSGANALRLLSVGRLEPHKGVDLLLAAVARARSRVPAIGLRVVGTGSHDDALRRRAASLGLADVDFAGFVDQPGLPDVYRDADCFVFPTLSDPFGIVMLEAAAAGLPLIGSPHGGATVDLVQDGVTGYVVDPADTDALAERIVELATDPARRESMGRAARQASFGRDPGTAGRLYAEAVRDATEQRGRVRRLQPMPAPGSRTAAKRVAAGRGGA